MKYTWGILFFFKKVFLLNSASSGGGGSRGAPQHYPKTAGNRYSKRVKRMTSVNNRFRLMVFLMHYSIVNKASGILS